MAPADLNARFGELRSALNASTMTQEGADEIWRQMFELATQAPTQFYEEVEPYVRQSGFFEKGFSIPMFRDQQGFEVAYEPLNDGAVWSLYSHDNDLYAEVGYGVALSLEAMALLGCPASDESLWLWHDEDEDEDDAPRAILAVDVKDILAQDATIKAKQKLCDKRLDMALGERAAMARRSVTPTFYLRLRGYRCCVTITIGPVERIEGSEGQWPSGVDGQGLDVVRKHGYYDQESELEGPALRCAEMMCFSGQGVNRFSLDEGREKSALARIKKAGLPTSRSYRFITHM